MIEGVRESAIEAGITDPEAFDAGVRDLHRTAEADGLFCSTFFKGVGEKPRRGLHPVSKEVEARRPELGSMDSRALIEELAAIPHLIGESIEGLREAQLRWKPTAEEFSILENIAHLRDLELEATTARIRRVLSEERPLLASFDGTAVANASRYNEEPVEAAFNALRLARERNVSILLGLNEANFERSAIFVDRLVTLRDLLEMLHGHDAEHVGAIRGTAETLAPGDDRPIPSKLGSSG